MAAVMDVIDLLTPTQTAEQDRTAWGVIVVITALVFWAAVMRRRSRPVAALLIVGLGYGAVYGFMLLEVGTVPWMAQAGIWVIAFGTIAEGTARLRRAAFALLAIPVTLDISFSMWAMLTDNAVEPLSIAYSLAAFGFFPVAVVVAAEAVRGRALLAAAEADRADQAERLRELDARAVAHDERLRLARELHDVVANRLSAVAMRITAADHVRTYTRTVENETLVEIGQEVSTALRELRSVLGTLRDDRPVDAAAPPPSLGDVDGLVEQVRRAGAVVEFSIRGEARPLPAMVDLTAYRIVQEALTNVVRHARPARATVRIEYHDDRVRLLVDDQGAHRDSPPITPPGHGILGMRERAALCGGWAAVGPRPDRGWRVEAVLPLQKGVS
jgi:signal transduction histidine kinase